MSNRIVAVGDDDFEEKVLKSELPVLVDFWAEWCAPCKSLLPILETVAEEYADRIKVVKLDTDHNPDTSAKFGIRGIPTLMLFKNGSLEGTKAGVQSKTKLTSFIDENI